MPMSSVTLTKTTFTLAEGTQLGVRFMEFRGPNAVFRMGLIEIGWPDGHWTATDRRHYAECDAVGCKSRIMYRARRAVVKNIDPQCGGVEPPNALPKKTRSINRGSICELSSWSVELYHIDEGHFVTRKGRIWGLLNGSVGQIEPTGATHASPFHRLLQRIRAHIPNANFYRLPA